MKKDKLANKFRVGTAAWTIPALARDLFFPLDAVKPSHLLAYASRMNCVEINSSFHRDHQGKTYARWSESTPESFRFSVKLAKRFTHTQKLVVDTTDLQQVLEGIFHLGEKLGVILVQLPPKLSFENGVAEDFFAAFRELYQGPLALEPRHPTWISRDARQLLEDHQITRVIADPAQMDEAPPTRSSKIAYFRLHGSPRTYYSNYELEDLNGWAQRIEQTLERPETTEAWCLFDNTALGHATLNALKMNELLSKG